MLVVWHIVVSAPDPNPPQHPIVFSCSNLARPSLPVVILDAIRAGVGLGLGLRLGILVVPLDTFILSCGF